MPYELQTTRRRMLALTGSLTVTGLAGCTESSGEEPAGEGSTSTPTETAEDHDDEEGEHDEGDDHHDEDTHDEEEGGHDDEGTHDHGTELPDGPSATAEVHMKTENSAHHFAPHVVWVKEGGTVTWNLESGSHNTVAYHPDNDKPLRMPEGAASWSSELVDDEEATIEHTFETAGVYDYYCAPHESMGMVATVIVGTPDAHGQPALEEPQDSLSDGARTELANLNEKVNEALGHTH